MSIAIFQLFTEPTFQNIYLIGGASLLHGLAVRLELEIKKIVDKSYNCDVSVTAVPNGNIAIWKGGSCLASTVRNDSKSEDFSEN